MDCTTYFKIKEVNSSTVIPNVLHSWNTQVLPSDMLWHLRLGHLSNDRMKSLNKQYGFIPIPNHTVCDICHIAK